MSPFNNWYWYRYWALLSFNWVEYSFMRWVPLTIGIGIDEPKQLCKLNVSRSACTNIEFVCTGTHKNKPFLFFEGIVQKCWKGYRRNHNIIRYLDRLILFVFWFNVISLCVLHHIWEKTMLKMREKNQTCLSKTERGIKTVHQFFIHAVSQPL